jgi:hypothetical protein
MAVPARKSELKTFHAAVHVTRVEEWCVDAETPEEARALLAVGQGHRCTIGDRIHVDFQGILDK